MKFFSRNKKAALIPGAIAGFILLYHLTGLSSIFSELKQPLLSAGYLFSFAGSPARKIWFGITEGALAYEKISNQEKKIALLSRELNINEDNSNERNFDEFSKIFEANIVEESVNEVIIISIF